MRPRAKFWLETETGEYLMGPRTLRLLEAVHESGSLKAGARAAGFSYRAAWARVRRVEAALGFKVIESRSGGEGGGRSRLTPEALVFVRRFRAFLEKADTLLERSFRDSFD